MSLSPPIQRFRDKLLADPSLLAHKLDFFSQRILFVRLTEADYRQASFLDDRILTPTTQGMWMGFEDVNLALAGVAPARPLHFIFHAGHVGSTLVSRLLEEAGGVLALREPLTLRALAEAQDALGEADSLLSQEHFDSLLREQILLWSRGYAGTRVNIVKATSATARLGPALLQACPTAQALYLNLPLEPYLAALLAGENSPIDLRGFAGERVRRLQRFGAEPLAPVHAMSMGELAAMSWAVERLSEVALAEAGDKRVLSLNFERLLAEPEACLRALCAHFQLGAPETYFTKIGQSPAWQRYAKAPEHPYSPQDRTQILAEARKLKSDEIRKGLLWFDAMATGSPQIANLSA
jgi:hypothetical protein